MKQATYGNAIIPKMVASQEIELQLCSAYIPQDLYKAKYISTWI